MGVCKVTNNQVITESRRANKKSQNSVIKERRGRVFKKASLGRERKRRETLLYKYAHFDGRFKYREKAP